VFVEPVNLGSYRRIFVAIISQVKIYAYAYLLPVDGGHLQFATQPDWTVLSHGGLGSVGMLLISGLKTAIHGESPLKPASICHLDFA